MKTIFLFIVLLILNSGCNQRLNPEELQKLKQAGIEEIQKGEFSQAAEKLEKAAEANPGDGEIYPYLAQCYENLGQYGKATETWQKFIFLSPRGSKEAEKGMAKLKDLESRKKDVQQ